MQFIKKTTIILIVKQITNVEMYNGNIYNIKYSRLNVYNQIYLVQLYLVLADITPQLRILIFV